jgi:hypothetical protein
MNLIKDFMKHPEKYTPICKKALSYEAKAKPGENGVRYEGGNMESGGKGKRTKDKSKCANYQYGECKFQGWCKYQLEGSGPIRQEEVKDEQG